MRSLMSTETRASSLFAAVAAAAGGAGPGGRHIVDSISCCMIIWCICAFCIISISYMSASTGTLTAIHATSCVVFMYYYNITFGFAYSAKFPQAQLQVKAGAQRSSEDYFCIKYNYNYYYFITQEKVPGVAKQLRKKIRLEWPSVLMVFNIKTVMQHNTIKSLHYNWIKLKKNLLLLFLISDYHHHYCDYGYWQWSVFQTCATVLVRAVRPWAWRDKKLRLTHRSSHGSSSSSGKMVMRHQLMRQLGRTTRDVSTGRYWRQVAIRSSWIAWTQRDAWPRTSDVSSNWCTDVYVSAVRHINTKLIVLFDSISFCLSLFAISLTFQCTPGPTTDRRIRSNLLCSSLILYCHAVSLHVSCVLWNKPMKWSLLCSYMSIALNIVLSNWNWQIGREWTDWLIVIWHVKSRKPDG